MLPPEHWAQAQAAAEAEDNSDVDSTYSGGMPESTASINSSILQYRTIQGRTYHSDVGNAQYWGSNDDKQNECLDIFHHIYTRAFGDKLFLAPLTKDIKKAVDIGCGTGIWAIDFADQFPDTQVIGTDISPIQPSWVPSNLEFQIDDCEQEWTFDDNSLDFVHLRLLNGSIKDWDALFKQAYRCLKPGGWIESVETSPFVFSEDGSVDDKSALSQWGKIFQAGGSKIGRSWTVVEDGVQERGMETAGFKKVQSETRKCPLSAWAAEPLHKELGTLLHTAFEQDMAGMVQYTASVLGDWSEKEVMVYMAQFKRELRGRKKHGLFRQKAVWAQKPGK